VQLAAVIQTGALELAQRDQDADADLKAETGNRKAAEILH
jgi:hypothetical protein